MGFLEKIPAFFSGGGKRKERAVELRLSGVEDFCAKYTEKERNELEQAVASKTAELKHFLSRLRAALKELEKAESADANRRRDKIVETARQNTVRQLGVLVQRLQPPSEAGDLVKMRQYCEESILLLNRELQLFGKNIAYASVSFKGEIKQLGVSFNELLQCLLGMRGAFALHGSVFLLGKVSALLVEIADAEKKAADSSREAGIALAEAGRLGGKIAEKEAWLQALRQGSEFQGIAALEEQKAALARQKQDAKTDVLSLFANVEKPLRRMQKAVAGRKAFLGKQEEEFLQRLLQNPFLALKGDPKGETLKKVLSETLKAVEGGAIDLKEREKEKRADALRELISFDFFGRVFWRFNEIDAGLVAVEKKLAESPVGRKESKAEAEIRDLRSFLSQKKKEAGEHRAVVEKRSAGLRSLHSKLEALVSEAVGKKVTVVP